MCSVACQLDGSEPCQAFEIDGENECNFGEIDDCTLVLSDDVPDTKRVFYDTSKYQRKRG